MMFKSVLYFTELRLDNIIYVLKSKTPTLSK